MIMRDFWIMKINEKIEKRHCNECNKNVKETIHTLTDYKVDYYTILKNSNKINICVLCYKKK